MSRLLALLGLMLLTVSMPPGAAVAKGPVDKITILAPGAQRPMEVTEEGALAAFDPWGRQFIDWERGIASEPETKTYVVSFHLDGRTIYVLEYAPDSTGEGG